MLSGNTKFEQTRNEIVEAALAKCRVGAFGEDLSAENMAYGSRELNSIIKFWQTQGFHIWKLPEAILFLEKGKDTYKLGTDEVHCTSELKETHLKFKAYQGQTEVYLKDLPEVGDKIGFKLCSDEIFFTTVAGIENGVVVLSDALPKDTHFKVFYYTNNISKPLKILQARREYDGTVIPMNFLEQEQFFKLVDYKELGTPLNYTYMPKIDHGELKIWHAPDNGHTVMKFIYEQEFDVFDVSKNTPDIPSEWIEPLTWELAYRLSVNYGLDINEREWLKVQAKETLEQAKRFDQETGSFFVYPAEYRGAF